MSDTNPSASEPQRLAQTSVERSLQWQANIAPPRPPSQSEVEAVLLELLPAEIVPDVLCLARPAIGLWPQLVNDPLAPSASRFGGMPYVPRDFSWPGEDGKPFWFLAAINCSEIAGLPGSDQLPSSGILAFFAEDSGVTAMDYGFGQVFHWPDIDDLFPAPPDRVPSEIMPLACMALRPLVDLPDQWSEAMAGMLGDRELSSRYAAATYRLRAHGIPYREEYYCGFSKLLGWPSQIQWEDPVRMRKDLPRMRLLLQLDEYANGAEMADWGGTGGSLYFVISDADLAAHRFEKCDFDRQFT
jgi:uncharacterized protein YwqG